MENLSKEGRVLISIRDRDYHFFVIGSIDSEPKGSESRETQESDF